MKHRCTPACTNRVRYIKVILNLHHMQLILHLIYLMLITFPKILVFITSAARIPVTSFAKFFLLPHLHTLLHMENSSLSPGTVASGRVCVQHLPVLAYHTQWKAEKEIPLIASSIYDSRIKWQPSLCYFKL